MFAPWKKSCLNILEIRRSRNDRAPRLGPSLEEVDSNSLEPSLRILKSNEIDESTKQIQERIQQINAKLSQEEENAILASAEEMDPVGYRVTTLKWDARTLQIFWLYSVQLLAVLRVRQ